MEQTHYNICMFAYNEEKHIIDSIKSVFANIDSLCQQVFVLANGCTDNTVALLLSMQTSYSRLCVIELDIGDKCNAWNHYVHCMTQQTPNVATHFFIDADVKFTPHVFPTLHQQLQTSPCVVVAGMPVSGRNKAYYQELVTDRACFFGNLYGMSQRFVERIKQQAFYLPVGLNWIDSFLTKAVNTDLSFDPHNRPNRVTYLQGHGYYFASLSPFSIDDLALYKNRIARYELGKLQEIILDTIPLPEWPRDMHNINLTIDAEGRVDSITHPIKKWLVKQRLQKLLKQGPKYIPEVSSCAE